MVQSYFDRAKNLADAGDYGVASLCIAVELIKAVNANDPKRVSNAQRVAGELEELMRREFMYQAKVEGLAVTESNRTSMMFDYSPHIKRREQFTKQIFSEAGSDGIN